MKQVDARDDSMKAGRAGVVELRGKDMQLDGGEPSLAAEINSEKHSAHSSKAWSERVERIRLCRFALDGDILGFKSFQEQQDGKKTHAESVAGPDFLRTEVHPAAVGYTFNEAVALTRSMVCFM